MQRLVINFKQERPLLFNLILLIFAALTGGLVWSMLASSSQNTLTKADDYDAFATNVTATKFSEKGTKQYELTSPRLNHYKASDQTYVDTPKLYMYTQQQDSWLISANHALATHGTSVVDFIQNVDVSGEHTLNHKNTQLLTEKISFYPDQNMAKNSLPVTIIQPGSIMHATGMEVTFNTGTIKLLSNINGSYDPNVHS